MSQQYTGSTFMYIGRFAPSPTGELHFGSLLAALASYLDAKSNQGLWRLRIDDIDPPREMLGAAEKIIDTLMTYGLEWDNEVIYQSNNYPKYQFALQQLQQHKLSYPCSCSRKKIILRCGNSHYDRHCLTTAPINASTTIDVTSEKIAWRFNTQANAVSWDDCIQGTQHFSEDQLTDFILQRNDSLWAYQLAVSVDDEQMGITHIVRGYDLLQESANQFLLIKALGYQNINFAHIPIITNKYGQKLSKQNMAPALTASNVSKNLFAALDLLGQKPNKHLINANKHDILHEAILNWDKRAIPQKYPTHYSG